MIGGSCSFPEVFLLEKANPKSLKGSLGNRSSQETVCLR